MPIQRSTWLAALALIAGMLALARGVTLSVPGSQMATPAQSALRLSTPVPIAASMSGSASTEELHPTHTEKVNLDGFAPPGLGRDLTILNCDNRHPWVCALPGQRTVDAWESVKYRHQIARMVSLPDRDSDTLFSYLEDNFNDLKPEHQLPSAYSQVWCDFDSLE